jgi:hypothetical protein
MSDLGSDRELMRRLAELRRADEASAPSFRQILERPLARREAASLRLALRLAVPSAVLAVILIVALVVRRAPVGTAVPSGIAALSEWKAPTDFLLRTPGSELFESLPQFSPVPVPVLVENARPGQRTKGVFP